MVLKYSEVKVLFSEPSKNKEIALSYYHNIVDHTNKAATISNNSGND